MVALSLYKGNLHRVAETPRRWLMPTPKISLKDFRILLRRRSSALARLPTPPSSSAAPTAPTTTTTSNPKTDSKSKSNPEDDVVPPPVPVPVKTEKEEEEDVRVEDVKLAEKLVISSADDVPKVEVVEKDHKLEVPMNHPPSGVETSNKEDATDKQKRKEIEDKLQFLNMKKHGLVQLLKQILNAEEELKRRNMQGVAVRSSLPLHLDTTNDTGSMTKLNTPRMGSDGNPIGEADADGGDDASNQNTLSRNLLRTSSTSPSSDSQPRKTPYNVVPLSSRSVGVTVSPSRFAPPGQQGQPSNLPPMSLSGTNFAASSPSPVASGGTSAFRDRFSSP